MKILKSAGKNKNYIRLYWVQCGCGKTYITQISTIKRGLKHCKSCSSRINGKKSAKHNMSNSLTYRTWQSMIDRCKSHKHYIDNNIKVCVRWKKFIPFFQDMGKRPSANHTIDRIDSNKNYKPSNCRWATWKEQNRNTKSNHLITFKGKTHCIAEWAEVLNFPPHVLYSRLSYNWSIEKSFTTPVAKRSRRLNQ